MGANSVDFGLGVIEWLFSWPGLITLLISVALWVCSTGLRAIVGEYFKQWFFRGPLRRASEKEEELAKVAQELRAREQAIENARAQLEGRILRKWYEHEAKFRQKQGAEN